MEEKKLVPKLRFPGFTEPWEQRKFGDVANIIMGQSPSSQNYTNNPNDDILVQGNADLIDGQVVPRLWTKEITKSIDEGNIIMTVRAPVGDVAKTAYKVVLGRGVAGIKGDEYIYQFLLKLKYNHYWRSLSSGSTFESINSNDIKNLIIDIPCDEERTKIGNLLRTTDTLITLHQRKLEHLKLKKKSLLQKLFPKEGEVYPELRFPGFTDPWEQRKFGELFLERREKTTEENEDILLSCAITGIYLNSDLFSHFRGSSTVGYLKVRKNDLILSAQNLHLGNANINFNFEHGMISPAYKVFEIESCDPYFVNAWVKKESTKIFFLKATTEGASQCRKNIDWDALINQELLTPNALEQETIGKFFNQLDRYITLHQRKLEHLQLLKKALLQQLFV